MLKVKIRTCLSILGVRTIGTSKSTVSSAASSGSVAVTSSNEVPDALSATGGGEGGAASMRGVESKVAPSGGSPAAGSSGSGPDSASATVGTTPAVKIPLSSTTKKKRMCMGLSENPLF